MKKLKKYSVVADTSDVYAISLVEEPAIEIDYIALNKDKEDKSNLKFIKDEKTEKYMVLGPALIPDKEIYRNYDGNEFYVSFSAECIERLSQKFMKNLYGGGTFTKDHESYAEGCYLAESWIKTTENDKSNDLGFDCPIGTWFVSAKIDSIELWQSIKNGERKGFSIESWVDLEEIVNKKENKENDMAKQNANLETMEVNDSFWDKLKGIIAEAVGTSKDDEVVEEAVEEAKEEAEPVSETVEAEEQTEEVTPEEVVEEVVEVVEEAAETNEEAAEDLQSVVDALQEEVDALKAENEELKKQNQKMAKQPSVKVNVKQSATKSNPMDVIEALRNGTYFK